MTYNCSAWRIVGLGDYEDHEVLPSIPCNQVFCKECIIFYVKHGRQGQILQINHDR